MKKAQFLGGATFWDTFTAFRVCWSKGRYGAGKTALSVIMAARLLAERRVDQVVSNIPLTFSIEPKAPLKRSAILLDESWIYIEGRRDVLDYAAFVRKHEHFLLLPSVFPVHNRLAFFTTQRVFNGYTVGLPIWFYRWDIRQGAVKENGYFGLMHPSAVFHHYPTKFVAGSDGGISDAIAETSKVEGFKGTRKEQIYERAIVDFGEEQSESIAEILDGFEQTAGDIVFDIEQEAKKIKKAVRR